MYELDLVAEPRLLRIEGRWDRRASLEFVSLSFAGTLALDGERYVVLVRAPGRPWTISRLEQDRLSANFQGNPLWPKQALSAYPKLSDYFGLSASASEDACLIPTYETVNAKLRALVDERFGYRALASYPRDASGQVSSRAYVDAYIDRRELPIGDARDRDGVHDWSYHFVSLLFPALMDNIRRTLSTIREQLRLFHGDTIYDWNYYGHTLDAKGNTAGQPRRERLAYAEAIYRQMAIALDVGTAKVVQILAMERAGQLDRQGHELGLVRTYLAGVGPAAIRNVLWMERELELELSEQQDALVYEGDPLAYLHAHLATLEQAAARLESGAAAARRSAVFAEVLARAGALGCTTGC